MLFPSKVKSFFKTILIKFYHGLLIGFGVYASAVFADTTISGGLTLTLPERGQTNWYQKIYDAVEDISEHDHTGSGKGLQIQTAAIANNAVDGTKIRLANDVAIRARNASNTADIELLKLNSSDEAEFGGNVTFSGTVSYSDISVSGGNISGITDLAVADGGTGSSTASGARTNLSAAASGANSDITSLSGLTTALSVAQGGTGGTSESAARTNLGLGAVAVDNVVPVSRGGTNATSASAARTSLGCAASGTNSDITTIDNIGNSTIRSGDGVSVTSGDLWLKGDNSTKIAIGGTDSGGTNHPWTFGTSDSSYITPPPGARYTYTPTGIVSSGVYTGSRTFNVTTATLGELRAVVGALIYDLQAIGVIRGYGNGVS